MEIVKNRLFFKKLCALGLVGVPCITLLIVLLVSLCPSHAFAQSKPFVEGLTLPKVDFQFEKVKEPLYQPLQLIMYLTIMTLIPYIMICTTSFVRVTIVFSFLKSSIGATHAPSQQVWIGLALILTLFIMAPVWARMEKEAIEPFKQGKITYDTFNKNMQKPLLDFMKANTRTKDLQLFVLLSRTKKHEQDMKTPPFHVMIPAFIISEMRIGFFVGFLFYLPFLCVDMITAAVLMSMGMFMLSPMSISMPLKVLTFCSIDGFELLCSGLVRSYRH